MSLSFENFLNRVFWIFSIALFFFLPWLSRGYGISFDEWNMANGGVLALRFIFSGGHDREILTFFAGQHPQFFYGLTGILYGLQSGSLQTFLAEGLHTEKHILPFFTLSHQLNATFGFFSIFFAGRIAKEIAGVRAGIIVLLLMTCSPRFVGDMMNNSKDIPFAGAYAAALFYMLRFLKSISMPQIKTIFLLAFTIAAGIGVRVGAYLFFFYLILFAGIFSFHSIVKARNLKVAGRIALYITMIFILAYLGGLVFWPKALVNPLTYPFEAFLKMSNFIQWDEKVLFEGVQTKASQLPWYYLPKWIGITVPVSVLTGWILFILTFWKDTKKYDVRSVVVVLLTGLFPLIYIIAKDSIVYDGWRHVLFIYAPLCILSAMGWVRIFDVLKNRAALICSGVVLAMMLALPVRWMLHNHPNEYVYFNPLVGGIKGAFSNYETDYFGNCIRQSSEWLMDYHEKNNPYRPLVVRADGHVMSSYPYLSSKFKQYYVPFGYPRDFLKKDPYWFIGYGPYLLGPLEWDYAILLSRGWEKAALEKVWPPPRTIQTVKADGVVICAVVKNPLSKLR